MATLNFNGSSHYVKGLAHGAMNGALTLVCLVKATGTNAATFMGPKYDSAFAFFIDNGSTPVLKLNLDGTSKQSVATINRTDWYLLAVTRAAGASKCWFHIKNLTTNAAWIHEEAATAHGGNPPSAAGGEFRLGYSMYSYWFAGDYALAAWWDGTALSDAQIEALSANKRTSDLHDLSPAPSSLTELNTLTPVDLKGVETWTVTGPTLTGGDPTGWTFDGVGAPPVEPDPTEGILKILTSTGWREIGGGGEPGVVETYEQLDEPEPRTIGAIWIRQEPL